MCLAFTVVLENKEVIISSVDSGSSTELRHEYWRKRCLSNMGLVLLEIL